MKSNKALSLMAGLTLAAISFSGCSIVSKEVVDCPQITALPEAAEAFIKTARASREAPSSDHARGGGDVLSHSKRNRSPSQTSDPPMKTRLSSVNRSECLF